MNDFEFDSLLKKYESDLPDVNDGKEKPSILVIDDDESMRRGLQTGLTYKYNVIAVPDGPSGIDTLNNSFCCVILDVKMKGMSGFEVYPALKQKCPEVPIVFFTAFQSEHDLLEIINKFKPDGYVEKGRGLTLLENLIEQSIEKYQLILENARVSEELKNANEELISLNSAKDKMISHLSHELKTPVAVLLSSIEILSRKLTVLSQTNWQPILERIRRNLKRLIDIEDEIYDIVTNKSFHHKPVFYLIFNECKDVLEALIYEETGKNSIVQKVKDKLEEIYSAPIQNLQQVHLNQFVADRLKEMEPLFNHREVILSTHFSQVAPIFMPLDPLQKVVDGLIRNAIENTPDGGQIHVVVNEKDHKVELVVQDQGIGLTKEAQKRIFEGFFITQETIQYSSKQPFDFNAGGKGADLLRMKIFSERFNFKIALASKRCTRLLEIKDTCPGRKDYCINNPGPLCDGTTKVSVLFSQKPCCQNLT
jgi:signal transduction histidine kinase